jgi:uncharacterized membrane protein (DUF2068 family)
MNSSNGGILKLVAVFKLLKAALLIVTGLGILRLSHTDIATQLDQWITRIGLDPGSRHLSHLLETVTNVPARKIRELGIGSFIYAALFLTEGIGLWLQKRWAEWFTVAITSSLVPLEIYEIYRHPTAVKIVVLLLNIAIVVYLLYRIFHESRTSQTARA